MSRHKISVYFILYHDLQFLYDIIARIDPYVDEIVIVDGPYTYSVDILRKCNLLYDEANRPSELTNIINKYPKIVYRYAVFNCEEEKRILGYNLCSHDNVLLVDSDEFFSMNMGNITAFIDNKAKFVGGFDIYNMNRTNISYNKKVTKYVFFKKHKICALDHLDYLWLVGCKTKQKVEKYMDTRNMLGVIYHQTLNRNKFNNIIKFIFYVSLYCRNNDIPDVTLLEGYKMDKVLEKCSIDTLLTIFYHSRIVSIGIPSMCGENICVVNNAAHTEMVKYSDNHRTAYFVDNTELLTNISAFFLLINRGETIRITFENMKSVAITLYEVLIGEPYIKHTFNYSDVTNNDITIHYARTSKAVLDTVIQFDCPSTLDGSFLYKIKRIE